MDVRSASLVRDCTVVMTGHRLCQRLYYSVHVYDKWSGNCRSDAGTWRHVGNFIRTKGNYVCERHCGDVVTLLRTDVCALTCV